MTVRILSNVSNRETRNAEEFRDALLASEPSLAQPEITADIICGMPLPGREIDLILLYHDCRDPSSQLKTTDGAPIHSFVLVVEIKQHSPDLIRFEGPKTLVRYNGRWSDASAQCDAQTWALKQYQKIPHKRNRRRQPTFVQRTIWLSRATSEAFEEHACSSSVPVQFAKLDWTKLVDGFVKNRDAVRTLVDDPQNTQFHSIDTLRETLTREVRASKLDLRRVDAVTRTRFNAEKTEYIQNLGNGLLLLRGRAGTGKTFALIQIALHLARQGKRTLILTFNHGLISDLNRALRLVSEKEPNLELMPELDTRYNFIKETSAQNLSSIAEQAICKETDIGKREAMRVAQLLEAEKLSKSIYDFVLIDEGQDWEASQRDLMFRLFGPERVIVADGVDQFVGASRCKWDLKDIAINRRHSLRKSRRTKASTCQIVGDIAHQLGLEDWDIEADPETHGGRFTVLVEPDPVIAVTRSIEILQREMDKDPRLKPIDNLLCLPSSKLAKGTNFGALFDCQIEASALDSWRGFDQGDRRIYPTRDTQLRAIQYQSCRGMEGWTTICLGLDMFFDFQARHPRIDVSQLSETLSEREGFLFSKELLEARIASEARKFVLNWLMIPLTRSIDHLVVHLSEETSELGQILRQAADRRPGAVEWLRPTKQDKLELTG